MTAIAKITAASPPASRDAWIETGRSLAAQRRDVDWKLGDWLAEGKQAGFIEQTEFDFLSENLGIAPKRLKDTLKAVEAFPAHLRDAALSVEHHASVAALPRQDALELLSTARAQHWTPERTRYEATHRAPTDEPLPRAPYRDEDSWTESAIHLWNRMPRSARLAFEERIAEAHGEEIEP